MTDQPQDLAGQVALVTGASSGIGEATAIALAARGADVCLVGRSAERLQETATAIARTTGSASVFPEDLAEDGGVDRVSERLTSKGIRLDIVVHCAGVYRRAPFETAPASELDEQWRINVRVPYTLTQAVLPQLRPGARIICVTSVAGGMALRDRAAYCMTKAALTMLVECLALELAPHGVRVNAVAPGFIATPMNRGLRADATFVRDIEAQTPAGRLGTPEEVAQAVLFLVSEAASFIHGETIHVSGGYPSPPQVGQQPPSRLGPGPNPMEVQ